MPPVGKTDKITPGRKFGRLTVVSDTGRRKKGYAVWRCRCDCGNETELSTKELKEKKISDCGCVTHIMYGAKDLTGQRFGKLKVLYPTAQRTDHGSVVWHAVCDCGRECDVSARRLVRGKVRSCGCLSSPPLKDYIGKTFGRWTVIAYAGTAKDRGLPGTANFWKCRCVCGKEGIVRQTELQNGDSRSCGCLRRECSLEGLKLVDGTSVVFLENGREKLRSDNTSGKTGVCFITGKQKWAAYITLRKKRYMLGLFEDKKEAVRVRTAAEAMHDDFIEGYYREYLPAHEERYTVDSGESAPDSGYRLSRRRVNG
ncbi:MAG: transcriptional regulator [Lachnospiraceae bacterium]|nr:transcriptional regulator [Lachnospiraceae bacterium]